MNTRELARNIRPAANPVQFVIPVRYVAQGEVVQAPDRGAAQTRPSLASRRNRLSIGMKLYFPARRVVVRSAVVSQRRGVSSGPIRDSNQLTASACRSALAPRDGQPALSPLPHNLKATLRERSRPNPKDSSPNISRAARS